MPSIHRLDPPVELHQIKTFAGLLDAGRIQIHRGDVDSIARPVHRQGAEAATNLQHFAAAPIVAVRNQPVEWAAAVQRFVPTVELPVEPLEEFRCAHFKLAIPVVGASVFGRIRHRVDAPPVLNFLAIAHWRPRTASISHSRGVTTMNTGRNSSSSSMFHSNRRRRRNPKRVASFKRNWRRRPLRTSTVAQSSLCANTERSTGPKPRPMESG